MTRQAIAAAAGLWLAFSAAPRAHRLDEYLQAARIALGADAVVVEIDLTPGVDVAGRVLSLVDRDADAVVSDAEQRRYALAVLADARLDVDGARLPLTLSSCEFPSIDSLRAGTGTVRLRATAPAAGGAGAHELRFANAHAPEMSVYLINALMPAGGIVITGQRRDVWQRELTLRFARAAPTPPARGRWIGLLSGLGVLGVLWRLRVRGRARPRIA
ncbi:MAG: hypothetical protein IT184_17245 [Acidobacteria bacterium]|nr:hypothetical protein [Acidobacteriota bacterium]